MIAARHQPQVGRAAPVRRDGNPPGLFLLTLPELSDPRTLADCAKAEIADLGREAAVELDDAGTSLDPVNELIEAAGPDQDLRKFDLIRRVDLHQPPRGPLSGERELLRD